MSNPKRLFPGLRKRISRFRLKHTYWTFTDSTGRAGFAVVGSPNGRHPYQRLYLNEHEGIRVQAHLYEGGGAVARRLIPGRGLVVLSEADLPDELANETVRVPNFIDAVISLPITPEAYSLGLPHSAREDVRRARKADYTFEISRDADWTAEFFCRYYRPSMQGRHGDEAYIMPQQEIAALVTGQNAEFVKILSGGICIAAMLAQVEGDNYHFLRLGWLNNDSAYVKQGAIAALYWFLIQRAFQLTCSTVFLGGTPTYLESGVLKFKMKWGAQLCGANLTYGFRRLLLDPAQPVCYRFLQKYSLIAFDSDDSLVVLSSKHPDQVGMPERILSSIKSWYVLRTDRIVQPQEGGKLPSLLNHWYEKIPVSTRYAEI
ncbi:hypothetical protein GCM10028803_33100 [Larkinella knui]|uniref:GNAT family N-acetyltransferase n=1 Tax=Larkinella knui TaxID=2025310 RepID=A0A3P1CYZ6_9BACT|nr:GNAT family N-acetyltransferase [Larkinella knui]RRB18320.1 GNAT family N-acetyltransferase [Larkinella knui]